MSEMSRMIDLRHLPDGLLDITANAEECAALAKRFDLVAVRQLTARIALKPDGQTVRASGVLDADVVQSCAVSAEDLEVGIHEPVELHFVPPAGDLPEELELDAEMLDQIEMEGGRFDLGEALAQTLGLAIDPYLEGPNAEEARREAGLLDPSDTSPFAALKDMFKKD
ncbi:MAG: YceD family protein [Novosphingobium sp.]